MTLSTRLSSHWSKTTMPIPATTRALLPVLGLVSLGALAGCDAEKALECGDVCAKVDECGATPPSPALEGLYEGEGSGVAALDCAANCVQPDAAFYGYSDCQIECILNEECGGVQSCWDATSDVYASYCLKGVETPDIEQSEGGTPSNGTNTGSAGADELTDNPAVEGSVDGSGFVVNTGDTPPNIAGLYGASGEIDESSNARPVGSAIRTNLCFFDQQAAADGVTTKYCEQGVPGIPEAPITGSGDAFTMYFDYGSATVLFSGTVDEAGNMTSDVEALVVYLHGTDIWEHSFTTWSLDGECDEGFCTN